MTDQSTGGAPVTGGRDWKKPLKLAAIVLVSAMGGAFASNAARHWHGHHHGFMAGPIDPAEVDKRVDWMTKHVARDVDATADQQTKLADIAKAAAKDMLPMRDKVQAARKEVRDLLTQPAVDRTAIEKLRVDQVANMDALSKRLSQAIGDAAEVLTPEQRKKLAERFPMGHGWHHDGDRS